MTTEEKKAFDLLLESLVAAVGAFEDISEAIKKILPIIHKNNVEVRKILRELNDPNILIPN